MFYHDISKGILFCASVAVVCMLAPPSVAAADVTLCRGHALPPAFEAPGTAPGGVFTFRNSVILIDDVGDDRAILACSAHQSGAFHVSARWPLPKDFSASDASLEADRLILKSRDGRTLEQIIEVGSNSSEGLASRIAPSIDGYAFTETRSSGDGLEFRVPMKWSDKEAPSKDDLAFKLEPVLPGSRIFDRKVLAIDPIADTATIFWEEAGQSTHAFIARIDRSGSIVAGAEIPLDDIETVSARFVGVLNDGRAYYLKVSGVVSEPVLLPLEADFAAQTQPGGSILERAQRKSLEAPQSPPSLDKQGSAPDAEFQTAVRKLHGDNERPEAAAAPSVTRASVVACAQAFSSLKWTLTPGSYKRAGVENECSPQSKYWRRPFYLNDNVGKQNVGVPYCWGCRDAIDTFLQRVASGSHLAGHSCTCRSGHYCLRSDATGVDCSGFVSQCWKSGYYTTSSMKEIADPVDIGKLKPGDAFNQAGSHIRLFIAIVSTSNGERFRLIEAANGGGSIGRVIEANYTASQLKSYKPVRYRKIVD